MFDYIDCDMGVHHRTNPYFNQSSHKINTIYIFSNCIVADKPKRCQYGCFIMQNTGLTHVDNSW